MFDPSAAVPKLFESLLESATRRVIKSVSGGAAKFVDMLRMNFSDYLYSAIDRTSHVKTLLQRDEPVDLLSIYVETFLESGGTTLRDDIIVERCRKQASICVIGSAGSGKTMFVRYLFLQLVEGGYGTIPIFVELRDLNSPDYNDDLVEFIYNIVVRPGAVVTKDQFRYCLRSALFILILDGLDEVEHSRRAAIERQIMNLRSSYPKLGIVISSRPDERLSAWSAFTVYRIGPMKKAQVKKLISRLPYEAKLRTKFIQEVDKNLYDKHSSFLSNPLLATMMLMTYDQFAHIPEKIHIFYEQAFETLYFRHDARKETAFRRKMYTDLAINDFRNCLSALCVSSYFKEKFQFSESEILDYIRKAAHSEKLKIIEGDYLSDLLESVCILQRDGLYLSFTHRSFQEYFAAVFIVRSPSIEIRDLLNVFCRRGTQDNVIGMAFDMNRSLIEREWILPKIRDLAEALEGLDPETNMVQCLDLVCGKIVLGYDGEGDPTCVVVKVQEEGPWFVEIIGKLYNVDFPTVTFWYDELGMVKDEFVRRGMYGPRTSDGFQHIELTDADYELVKGTSLFKTLRRNIDSLMQIKSEVQASVSEQKRLSGVLFE